MKHEIAIQENKVLKRTSKVNGSELTVRQCKDTAIPVYAMEASGGKVVLLHSFLTSAPDGGEWVPQSVWIYWG
jgi:hypothetical protein